MCSPPCQAWHRFGCWFRRFLPLSNRTMIPNWLVFFFELKLLSSLSSYPHWRHRLVCTTSESDSSGRGRRGRLRWDPCALHFGRGVGMLSNAIYPYKSVGLYKFIPPMKMVIRNGLLLLYWHWSGLQDIGNLNVSFFFVRCLGPRT
jgi:hypothetical protein